MARREIKREAGTEAAKGNPDHIERIRTMSRDAWNEWRRTENAPDLQGADLSGLDLSGFDLKRVILAEANCAGTRFDGASLAVADCISSDMTEACFDNAYMEEALFGEAILTGAKFRKADVTSVNFIYADLSGADFTGADLGMARLAQATLDRAILSEANLWETQRADWSIKDVVCEAVFWDGEGKERTIYTPGEFERLHGTFPKIHLTYKGEMGVVDVLALPVFLRSLERRYPSCHFQIRSVGEAPGGAQASIAILDAGGLPAEMVAAGAQQTLTVMAEAFRMEKQSSAELQRNLFAVIERLLADSMSRRLPGVSVNHLTVGPGATVQLAGNDANIRNEYLNPAERNELAQIIGELRHALTTRGSLMPEPALNQAITLVAVAEDEAAKEKPSKKIVTEALKTLRNITEGAIGGLIASGVQDRLFALIKALLGG